ncbi:iron-sulfur cluster assembly accessory protein [Alcanivorax marinus]|uniref:Iron-sulfur cluster assembly accessory protein n=1 Tax=Alloalcanivorax marinus TaxID=1177169 RepID=A0A9Q3UJG1_9GAMM|nr:iron-sulfur cluster assembly accessory protein [Alloalcanivorax marinus]MCC4307340.1 iron-sulfur cluster assembly accessory protein [Alloalcanivorax marinus]MCH2558237.1 iron-sulfur cluster assembly accessory protein [Alcanivorax sp.]
MTVQTFVPGQAEIHLTPAARDQARREIARANAGGIRLDLDESGCSGYMYELNFVEQPQDGDRRFEVDGVVLYVPEKWLAMLNGLQIDYVKEGVNSLFKFRNPNATGECGCGESFTVEDMDEV